MSLTTEWDARRCVCGVQLEFRIVGRCGQIGLEFGSFSLRR